MQETPKSDDTVETLVRFASGLEYEDIPAEAIWEAKRRIIDSIAIALAGFQEEPSVIARRFALASTGSPGATVIGTKHVAFPELAVLANGTMLHSQDFMDTYLSRESLHPSDTIAAVLAAAEVAERNGNDVILGVVLAYEVMCRLADVANVRERGWDHVVFGVIASALAAARVLGSSADDPRFFRKSMRRKLYKQDKTCHICHQEITGFDDATVDHVQPYSKGGRTTPDNARLAHRFCNSSKGAR